MSRYGGAQRVTHLDAVVMEVRVGQELIGGVVHVRGQELTHKVAVDVRLGRHVVGEAKQIIPAHVSADYHCVNEVRSKFCDVQVVENIANEADGSTASAVGHVENTCGRHARGVSLNFVSEIVPDSVFDKWCHPRQNTTVAHKYHGKSFMSISLT